jgi:hypothetical protein
MGLGINDKGPTDPVSPLMFYCDQHKTPTAYPMGKK